MSYDSRGSLVEARGPEGRVARRDYDAERRLIAEDHPGGGSTTWRHIGPAMVERTLPDGGSWKMGYDALIRPLWLENPDGERHTFSYDAAGQLIMERTFAGVELSYEYDLSGRRVKETRSDGNVGLVFDKRDNLCAREHSSGSRDAFEYDSGDRIVRATTAETEVILERDTLGRVVTETQTVGGWRFSVAHQYNDLGYRVVSTCSTGWGVAVDRDNGGAADRVFILDENNVARASMTLSHGGVASVSRDGTQQAVHVTRDTLGRMTLASVIGNDGEVIAERKYTWAAQRGLLAVTDGRGERTYELDPLGRPTRVAGMGATETYGYTCHGAPQAMGRNERFAPVGRKIETDGVRFSWDALGRLERRIGARQTDSWTYRYDDADRLVEASRDDGFSVRYVYDAFGRRLASLRSDGGSTFFGWGWRLSCRRSPQQRPQRSSRVSRRRFHAIVGLG